MSSPLLHKLENEIIKKRDFSLIKQTLGGNNMSFARLMQFYQKRIFRLGLSFFHNEADTEDFVQDVFLKVYTKLNTFKYESMFQTWLMRIAYTTAMNCVNRRKEYLPIADEDVIPDRNLSPEENQIRSVTAAAIREAIKKLPQKYAVCVEMYFSYDIPYQQISDITGFPVNTIKSHIFRAKKILKDKLEAFLE